MQFELPQDAYGAFELAPPASTYHPSLSSALAMHDAFDVMAPMSVMLPPAPPASELPEPEPPAKQCEQCAAVKRLKGGVSIDGLSAWHARPCVHGMNALDNDKTGPQAPPGGVSSLCMRSALKEDLRPRRLFDLGGDSPAFGGNDDELNADEEELGGVFGDECDECDEGGGGDGGGGGGGGGGELSLSAAPSTVMGGSPTAVRPTSALALSPSRSPFASAGTPMMTDVDQLELSIVVPDTARRGLDGSTDDAQLPPLIARSCSSPAGAFARIAPPMQPVPTALLDQFLAAAESAVASSAMFDDVEPPPLLAASSFEAAAAARATTLPASVLRSPSSRRPMAVIQSPALAYAAARMIVRDGGGSSCATPSRTPGPGRPATPGAPGSNVRRTMSVIDGISRDLQEGDYEGVPSITDSAVLLQLTQGLTLITLGSKRAFDERD
jgi:hypothetical protein